MRDWLLVGIIGVLLPAILVNPMVGGCPWVLGLPLAQNGALTRVVAFFQATVS